MALGCPPSTAPSALRHPHRGRESNVGPWSRVRARAWSPRVTVECRSDNHTPILAPSDDRARIQYRTVLERADGGPPRHPASAVPAHDRGDRPLTRDVLEHAMSGLPRNPQSADPPRSVARPIPRGSRRPNWWATCRNPAPRGAGEYDNRRARDVVVGVQLGGSGRPIYATPLARHFAGSRGGSSRSQSYPRALSTENAV
jgi:hypothetical protein